MHHFQGEMSVAIIRKNHAEGKRKELAISVIIIG